MRKILVVRFSSLGDIILTTPVYRNLKNWDPHCFVAVAVKAKFAEVLRGNSFVDKIIELEEGGSLFSFAAKIRKEKFDILIDLHNNFRSNFISLLSGAGRVIRYRKAALERRLFVQRKVRNPELGRHTVDRYLEALKSLGIEPGLFTPEISVQPPAPKADPLKILVVQTAFLGDAVLTTPVFAALRRAMPQARVTLLCTPEIEQVFSGNKNIDEVLTLDKHGKDKGLSSIWAWAEKLRGRFDAALVPHRSFRSAFLVWLARIPRRIGFENSQGRIFFTETVAFDWKRHDAERNLKLLEPLGIWGLEPEIQVPAHWGKADLDGFLKEQGLSRNQIWVGMNPGSVWNTKRWLPEGFARVADALIEEWGCKVILFGSKKDAEASRAVGAQMKHKPVDLSGKTDLRTLSYLVSQCSLFVTNDSGPMHLASATGVPVVAIFGPTTRELGFFPYGSKSAVIEIDLSCRPCTLHGGNACPLEHFRCMREITAEMVLEPSRRFLSERYPEKKAR